MPGIIPAQKKGYNSPFARKTSSAAMRAICRLARKPPSAHTRLVPQERSRWTHLPFLLRPGFLCGPAFALRVGNALARLGAKYPLPSGSGFSGCLRGPSVVTRDRRLSGADEQRTHLIKAVNFSIDLCDNRVNSHRFKNNSENSRGTNKRVYKIVSLTRAELDGLRGSDVLDADWSA